MGDLARKARDRGEMAQRELGGQLRAQRRQRRAGIEPDAQAAAREVAQRAVASGGILTPQDDRPVHLHVEFDSLRAPPTAAHTSILRLQGTARQNGLARPPQFEGPFFL